jgi:hypothetical protein
MVNEDDVLLVSGGFSMDACHNSLADQVSQLLECAEQTDSQRDKSLDPRIGGAILLQQDHDLR